LRFYYDTANAMTIHPLVSLTKLVAPTQILFGTDFPFLTASATAAGLREVDLFSVAELQDIERENAAQGGVYLAMRTLRLYPRLPPPVASGLFGLENGTLRGTVA
jgi:hypothetical protein